jgi:hypothetical protein
MKTLLIILAAIMLVGTFLMVYWLVNAPIGYEDEDTQTFKYGVEKKKK